MRTDNTNQPDAPTSDAPDTILHTEGTESPNADLFAHTHKTCNTKTRKDVRGVGDPLAFCRYCNSWFPVADFHDPSSTQD